MQKDDFLYNTHSQKKLYIFNIYKYMWEHHKHTQRIKTEERTAIIEEVLNAWLTETIKLWEEFTKDAFHKIKNKI